MYILLGCTTFSQMLPWMFKPREMRNFIEGTLHFIRSPDAITPKETSDDTACQRVMTEVSKIN